MYTNLYLDSLLEEMRWLNIFVQKIQILNKVIHLLFILSVVAYSRAILTLMVQYVVSSKKIINSIVIVNNISVNIK